MIDVSQHDRFVVTRRRIAMGMSTRSSVHGYDFKLADAHVDAPAVCNVRQRVSRFVEPIGFYAGEAAILPLMYLDALPRFDPWARCRLVDANLRPIRPIHKAFVAPPRRSPYVLYGREGEEIAGVEADVPAAVARRRAGGVAVAAAAGAVGVPFIGAVGVAAVASVAVKAAVRQMRNCVDPVDVASELRIRSGEQIL